MALTGIKAQNNLVVFTENGEKFFLIINGVKQNIEAETNVKVTDLTHPNYKAKIVFEDKAKGVVDQTIYLMQAAEPVKNYEFVYSVAVKKKGTYKARCISAVAIGPQTKSDPEQTVVHYATSEPTESNNNVIHVADDGGVVNESKTVTKTETITNSNNVNSTNVGVGVNGANINININDNMGGMGVGTTITSQTITTTTSSSEKVSGSTAMNVDPNAQVKKPETVTPKKTNIADNTLSTACGPMSPTDFDSAKESIASKSFDDSKLKVAKQILGNNCMSTEQVKEVMGLFGFEQAKLDFAKYAYPHTSDQKNYYKVNDAFTFQSSITDLDKHIKRSKNSK